MTSHTDLPRTAVDLEMIDHNVAPVKIHDFTDSLNHSGGTDLSIPEALRYPRYPKRTRPEEAMHVVLGQKTNEDDPQMDMIKRDDTPFRPAADIAKTRTHSTRYNLIRPLKSGRNSIEHAPGPKEQSFEVERSGRRSKDGLLSPRREESASVLMGRVTKAGTPHRRIPHDHSKGPSMTKQAVDYRERKTIQAEYQKRLAELIDEDIVRQVENEGGITPLGRLLKASVRMLELGKETHSSHEPLRASFEAIDVNFQALLDENSRLRKEAAQAKKDIDDFKEKLKHLLEHS